MIAFVEPPVGNNEPAAIATLQKTVSASRLNCWLQCRLKFFFRYVLKLTKPKTAALHYGLQYQLQHPSATVRWMIAADGLELINGVTTTMLYNVLTGEVKNAE